MPHVILISMPSSVSLCYNFGNIVPYAYNTPSFFGHLVLHRNLHLPPTSRVIPYIKPSLWPSHLDDPILCHPVQTVYSHTCPLLIEVLDFISVAKYITDALHMCDISWVHLELDLGAITSPLSLLLKIVHKI